MGLLVLPAHSPPHCGPPGPPNGRKPPPPPPTGAAPHHDPPAAPCQQSEPPQLYQGQAAPFCRSPGQLEPPGAMQIPPPPGGRHDRPLPTSPPPHSASSSP